MAESLDRSVREIKINCYSFHPKLFPNSFDGNICYQTFLWQFAKSDTPQTLTFSKTLSLTWRKNYVDNAVWRFSQIAFLSLSKYLYIFKSIIYQNDSYHNLFARFQINSYFIYLIFVIFVGTMFCLIIIVTKCAASM